MVAGLADLAGSGDRCDVVLGLRGMGRYLDAGSARPRARCVSGSFTSRDDDVDGSVQQAGVLADAAGLSSVTPLPGDGPPLFVLQ